MLALGACMLCADASAMPAAATVSCADAASFAEHNLLLPAGLLRSIGVVETGNRPWSVNVDGAGRNFASADEAVRFVRSASVSGGRYVDVGCFQMDLFYHPKAFENLAAAFDPMTNAMAAGRFLLSLQQGSSSWFDAVGRYHSSLPSPATAYAGKVFAALDGTFATREHQAIRTDATLFGMRITVPGSAPMSPASFRLAGLPVVQTP